MRSQSKVLIAALGAAFVLGAGVSMARSGAHIEWLNGLSVLLSTFLTFDLAPEPHTLKPSHEWACLG